MPLTPDALVREWFDQVWNNQDESAIDRLMHPDAKVHGLGDSPLRGPEGFKPLFRTFRDAIGPIKITVERTVVEGDTCAAVCRVVGKHTGPAFGGPPTNRDVEFQGMTIARMKDGKIIEGWNSFDFLTMYQQLGWVPNPVLPPA